MHRSIRRTVAAAVMLVATVGGRLSWTWGQAAATTPAATVNAATRANAATTVAAPTVAAPTVAGASTALATTAPSAGTVSAVATAPAVATTGPAATQPADLVNNSLAERMAYQMAQGLLRARTITPASWTATHALLEGAVRLDPNNERLLRLLVEAAMRNGDNRRALEVLTKYRQVVAGQGIEDQVALTQWIDLYLASTDETTLPNGLKLKPLQTTGDRLAYLRDLVSRTAIPAPVRSYAAYRCAEMLIERAQDAEAIDMIDQSLRLNPINLAALRIRYQTVKNGTPADRMGGMLAMLAANPAQPALAMAVAQELADVGLVVPSLEWYYAALGMYARTGAKPGSEVLVDYGAQLYIQGDLRGAEQLSGRMLQAETDTFGVWHLRLLVAKVGNDKDMLAQLEKMCAIAMTNRVGMLKREAGDQTATTQPVDPGGTVPVVNVAADLATIQKANKPEMLSRFLGAAEGMAWLKIYFEEKPADAQPWLDAMAKLLRPDDPVLARLQGWALLKAGKAAEARAKLTPAAEQDPLAKLGLILVTENTPAAQQKANAEAEQLFAANPSGITGAILSQVLTPRGVRLVPGPMADAVQRALSGFPKEWLQVGERPEKFYSLRLEPVHAAVQIGEPILLRVTITNVGDYDITVGPEGIIHPDLWLDAQLLGANPQSLGAESFDRLSRLIVLPSHQTMSQEVRLDTNRMTPVLASTPMAAVPLTAMVMTNPTTVNGSIGTGLCGYRVRMNKLVERQGAPIFTNEQVRQKLSDTMQSGTPPEKVRVLEVLATYYQLFTDPNAGPEIKQAGQGLADAVRRSGGDVDPSVRAWGMYVMCLLTSPQERSLVIRRMVSDPSWQARLLAPVVVELTGQGTDLIKALENDSDPIVKQLAMAVSKMPPPQAKPEEGGPAGAGATTAPAGPAAPAGGPGAAPAATPSPEITPAPAAAPAPEIPVPAPATGPARTGATPATR